MSSSNPVTRIFLKVTDSRAVRGEQRYRESPYSMYEYKHHDALAPDVGIEFSMCGQWIYQSASLTTLSVERMVQVNPIMS